MNIRKTILATTVAALMTAGVVGQAVAYVGAGSSLQYQNLSIQIFDDGTQTPQFVRNFDFRTTNTATLSTTGSDVDTDTCSGTATAPLFDVTQQNDCNATTPRLDSLLIKEGTTSHGENDFDFEGPGSGDTFSYADSVINTAQLAGDATTSQIGRASCRERV